MRQPASTPRRRQNRLFRRLRPVGLALLLGTIPGACTRSLRPPLLPPSAPGADAPHPVTDAVTGLTWQRGAVRRGPTNERVLALLFTGHTFAEGGETILNELARHGAKASFFLTGEFLDTTAFAPLVRRMISEGH